MFKEVRVFKALFISRDTFRKLEKAVAVSGVYSGVLQENSRKVPGKLLGKFLPGTGEKILGFRGPGKANLPGTLGPHCGDLVPTFRAGCFLKSTVPAFSSFSDTCSDSIAKLFRACFCGGGGGASHKLSRDMLVKSGIAQMCLCKTKYEGGGVSHLIGELLTSLDSIAISRDMGPLSPQRRSRNAKPNCSENDILGFQHVETWRIRFVAAKWRNCNIATCYVRNGPCSKQVVCVYIYEASKITNHKWLVIWNRRAQIEIISLKWLSDCGSTCKSESNNLWSEPLFRSLFVSQHGFLRIKSHNIDLSSGGSQCLKPLVTWST